MDGSSKNWTDQIIVQDGLLSNSTDNYFADAIKIKLPACDGASQQGYRKSSISYKGESIFFKGHIITQSRLDDIEKNFGLFSNAT